MMLIINKLVMTKNDDTDGFSPRVYVSDYNVTCLLDKTIFKIYLNETSIEYSN